ncbi:MAG: phenylalanine--tRNA ligase subunit beta, partial [Chloroflexi bacterium]|nr:phenylalanine--tRNA ligase subunit beta [Chloroflexota bacterium]
MRIPLSWLRDYVNIELPPEELAERLTLAGLEVETIQYVGLPQSDLPWDRDKVVVGEVLAVRPHPDADRLVLADVEYGGPALETVVTGAPSFQNYLGQRDLHLKVAFALEGAALYDGHATGLQVRKLKRSKIRGVESRAMVCSEKELGLSDEHEDIIYLPEDAPVGTPLVDYLGDAILEFDIKGPFGHLYSMIGIAREISAILQVPLNREALRTLDRHPTELTPAPSYLRLQIADPDLCPRYSAAYIQNVAVKPSPFWVQTRLRRAGMRPINNIVDVTNYVMLELGQPLHAFDYHTLRPQSGDDLPAIIVRRAHPGETMKTLDSVQHTFDDDMLLITDGQGPVAIAGVMGGLETEVTETTTDILLESANFSFLNVRRTSRLLAMTTEASQRFGRQVDPELATAAAARAAWMIAELSGGTVARIIGDAYPGRCPERTLHLDPDYVTRLLGVEISAAEMTRILTSLEFEVVNAVITDSAEPAQLHVTVPSHRLDVSEPVDLVEEIGRIWGYNCFPTTLMRDELPPQRTNHRLEGAERIRDILVGCGLDEVITYSLVNIEDEGKLHPYGPDPDPAAYLRVRNPLSSERAYLRQSLLPSLLSTTQANLRFTERVCIFEIGSIYLPIEHEVLPKEPRRLAVVMTGPREERSWLKGQDRTVHGFYDVKGVVEALLRELRLQGEFVAGDYPALHPGRCAQIIIDGET